ncbi:alpha/beta fold hydrolase [Streptomyces canus]|uniref:thioesterase II family protein n=1 Tax=Streptomyces canus TaxID=58343 RepID=UPI00225715E8|nr:alpha/beta fold hydrolase [Streptomyces canus]MCX4854903.1 alpha/beta fold hydrolase [Streptomyces canus]WSW39694.1 alpha/beta fold hydrolase [Streptomyces canus]
MPITERPPGPATDWFPGLPPATGVDSVPLRLICFPYAGGTPSVYRGWGARLGTGVQVVPVLLPGRGLRLREQPYTAMRPLARDIADALVERELARDYVLFGHSMGALLAYEVACELRERGHDEPRHLFVSGSRAPHLYGDRDDRTLSDADLRQLVCALGGLGDDRTVAGAYLDRRLPVLRADLTVCEEYRWIPRPPLACPMTAFSATRDPIAPGPAVEAWRSYSSGSLLHHHLEGDHFFLNGPSKLSLLREIRSELARLTDEPGEPAPDAPDRLPTPKREPSWTC